MLSDVIRAQTDVFSPDVLTHLHALHSTEVATGSTGNGGALTPLGNDLLVVTPKGRIARVRPPGDGGPRNGAYGDWQPAYVEWLEGRVPMNLDRLEAHRDRLQSRPDPSHPDMTQFQHVFGRFRVADILLKESFAGRHRLFVTHHHFTEGCIRFRLSSTNVVLREGSVSLATGWRTLFDAEPCILGSALHQAGGTMVTDGPDHLLVVIGDHSMEDVVQAVDSHLGKLVRIDIETGAVETVASGLRNPQGLVRDGDGVLWATEHGPWGGDELNILRPGENYGWPLVTLGVGTGGVARNHRPLTTGDDGGFAHPVFSRVPSVGISSILVNDERRFPLWKDDLLIASLAAESLFRVRLHDRSVQYAEKIEVGFRIRDLAQLPDGHIVLLDDAGCVRFLSRSHWHCGTTSVYAIGCP